MKLASIVAAAVILFSILGTSHAVRQRTYQGFQSVGSVEYGTTTVISVTTTPAIVLSTGNMPVNPFSLEPGFGVYPTTGVAGTTITVSDFMSDRMFMEIYNDSAVDIWLGYDARVSSIPGANYGRKLPPGGAWSHDCAIMHHWAIAGSSTGYKIVITQER